MHDRIRILVHIAIMTVVGVATSGVVMALLYDAAFEQERARLVVTVQSQARLMEAMARFNAVYNLDYSGGAAVATISQIIDGHEWYAGFGETGEFTIARRQGENIVFILRHRIRSHDVDFADPKPVPFDSELAEPTRRVLLGESGSVIGLDYRGTAVLAAYEPVAGLELGIVAKIDLTEIRAPFVRAGGIAASVAVLLIVAGALFSYRINNPILRRLQESARRVQTIMDSVLDGIFTINEKGVIESFNQAAVRMFGYSAEEVVGENANILMPERHSSENDGFSSKYLRTGKAKIQGIGPREVTGRRKDETTFPMDLAISEMWLRDKRLLIGIVRDITKRKQAEEALQLTQFTIDNAGDAAFWLDRSGRLVFVNEATCKLLGYSREELLHLSIPDIDPDATLEDFARTFARIRTQGSSTFEARHRTKDGKIVLVEVSIYYVKYGDSELMCSFSRDITERKQAQAQLVQASKLATLGEMATAMAHELNQPLNVIRMAADNAYEQVKDGRLEAEFLGAKLERIAAQTERASDLIDRMRVFGRKPEEEPENVDLGEVANTALGFVKEELRLASIELETKFARRCPRVVAHPAPLEQVVLNLLGNARDAIEANRTSPGEPRKISLIVEEAKSDNAIRLVVEDTGGGIPEDVLPRIFEPFFTTKETGKGTGLGLSISYGIVSDMGGTIEAANAGDGARLTITLPVAAERAAAA